MPLISSDQDSWKPLHMTRPVRLVSSPRRWTAKHASTRQILDELPPSDRITIDEVNSFWTSTKRRRGVDRAPRGDYVSGVARISRRAWEDSRIRFLTPAGYEFISWCRACCSPAAGVAIVQTTSVSLR
jgi:hypothetical protein